MTEKWADYLISKVEYNVKDTHIVKVLSHPDEGENVGTGLEVTRSTVVSRLDNGSTYMTIYKNPDGTWKKGAPVRVVKIDGDKYIRTDADNTKKDNLGALPRF
jgi:hypothetical protein